MRYFGFLVRFVVLPLTAIRLLMWWDKRRGRQLPAELTGWPEDKVLLAHAAVAVAYTTIWDNYLVYSRIWGYDPHLVTGIRLGWVPIEEYTFFVLQPLLTGSLLLWRARRTVSDPPTADNSGRGRVAATVMLGAAWIAALLALARGGRRARYLSLIFAWGLPPIMLQTAFGGDILWRHRKLILSTVIPASVYLGAADSRAIRAGTWNISPEQTVGIDVIPHLPLEEFAFFCLTNLVLAFGVTLVMSTESERRLPNVLRGQYERFKARFIGPAN